MRGSKRFLKIPGFFVIDHLKTLDFLPSPLFTHNLRDAQHALWTRAIPRVQRARPKSVELLLAHKSATAATVPHRRRVVQIFCLEMSKFLCTILPLFSLYRKLNFLTMACMAIYHSRTICPSDITIQCPSTGLPYKGILLGTVQVWILLWSIVSTYRVGMHLQIEEFFRCP